MRRLGVLLARTQVRMRAPLIVLWVAAAVYVFLALPGISGDGGATPQAMLPSNAAALRTEQISATRFAFPLLSRTEIVVRNRHGLSAVRQAGLTELATQLTLGRVSGFSEVAGALPLSSTLAGRLARKPGTTVLLYLYFRPSVKSSTRVALARRLIAERIGRRRGEFEGVTGTTPARYEQSAVVNERLPWVELASLVLVVLAVGLRFRALGVSLLALLTVAGAYVISDRLVGEFGRVAGLGLPEEIKPVLIVLVFGVATDYAIFFMSRFRDLLAEGVEAREAATAVIRQITPIVFAAGATVAAGTGTLAVAGLGFLKAFGPGLAVAVAVAASSAIVLVPATLAVAGARLYWPHGVGLGREQQPPPTPGAGRFTPIHLAVRHPLLAASVTGALVIAGASGLHLVSIGDEIVKSLPGSEVTLAYKEAQRGFHAGVVSPGVVVVEGPGVARHRPALDRLEASLERQRGVVGVIGPREQPLMGGHGIALAGAGNLARFLFFLSPDPLGPQAIADVTSLNRHLPGLLNQAGLRRARGLLGGDSALAGDIVESVLASLGRLAPAMLVGIFLVVAIFLRALVAPAYLVLTSALAAASAIGLSGYFLQDLGGYGSLTYYMIFTVSVLLVSLGSDYNIFMVGRIWQEGSRRRRLADAVEGAARTAARPITVAGMILAMSFALLAIVPIRGFREIAFAMGVGLVIDSFVVRAVLVPALIVLVGRRSAWPGRGFETARQPTPSGEEGLPAHAAGTSRVSP